MRKGEKIWLCLVMAAALCVLGVLGAGMLRDRSRMRELEGQLAVSRAAWENTAERKETLQAELKTVTEALKEAKLTLEESTARAEELRQEIARLEQEIARLRTE